MSKDKSNNNLLPLSIGFGISAVSILYMYSQIKLLKDEIISLKEHISQNNKTFEYHIKKLYNLHKIKVSDDYTDLDNDIKNALSGTCSLGDTPQFIEPPRDSPKEQAPEGVTRDSPKEQAPERAMRDSPKEQAPERDSSKEESTKKEELPTPEVTTQKEEYVDKKHSKLEVIKEEVKLPSRLVIEEIHDSEILHTFGEPLSERLNKPSNSSSNEPLRKRRSKTKNES